jgi:hypothetical protein
VKSALRNDLERLRRDALSERHRHAFEAGRAKQPAIAEHADAASVLAMLDDEVEALRGARGAHRGAHPRAPASRAAVWASLLLGAFKPMLVRLRGRLVSDTVPGDELTSLSSTAFLRRSPRRRSWTASDAAAPAHRATGVRLPPQGARAAPPRHRRRGAGRTSTRTSLAPRRARTDEELYDLALLIQRAVQEGLSTSGLDVVEATVLRRELLRA